MRVRPPQGLSLGNHALTVASGWSVSNPATVTLAATTQTVALAPPTVTAGQSFSIYIGGGPALAGQALLTLSLSNAPSVAPGIVSLGIGNAFTSLVVLPQPTSLPASSKAGRFVLPSVASMRRTKVYFQAVLITRSLPLPASNVETTLFR